MSEMAPTASTTEFTLAVTQEPTDRCSWQAPETNATWAMPKLAFTTARIQGRLSCFSSGINTEIQNLETVSSKISFVLLIQKLRLQIQ